MSDTSTKRQRHSGQTTRERSYALNWCKPNTDDEDDEKLYLNNVLTIFLCIVVIWVAFST